MVGLEERRLKKYLKSHRRTSCINHTGAHSSREKHCTHILPEKISKKQPRLSNAWPLSVTMHYQYFLAAAIALLSTSTQACKCINDSGEDITATRNCCASLNGEFQDGNDCEAGSISDHLSNFYSCCQANGDISDCSCPEGC